MFKLDTKNASNLNQMIEAIGRDGYIIAQAYVAAASKGDIRFFLMNGAPAPDRRQICRAAPGRSRRTTSARTSTPGAPPRRSRSARPNLRVAEMIRPKLIADGMFLVGVDIVGDKILEVNVFSPGNLGSCSTLAGVDFAVPIIDSIERKVAIAKQYAADLRQSPSGGAVGAAGPARKFVTETERRWRVTPALRRSQRIFSLRHDSLTPTRALLLGFPIALFLGALLSDIAYYRSFEIQWANFAAWLNAGALLFGGIVLAIAAIDFFRHRERRGRAGLYLAAGRGDVDRRPLQRLDPARDGWAMMPMGLILSVIVAVLASRRRWPACGNAPGGAV